VDNISESFLPDTDSKKGHSGQSSLFQPFPPVYLTIVQLIGVRRGYAGYVTAYPKHRAFFLKLQKINKNYDIFGLMYIM
jgi:hypothetical protein